MKRLVSINEIELMLNIWYERTRKVMYNLQNVKHLDSEKKRLLNIYFELIRRIMLINDIIIKYRSDRLKKIPLGGYLKSH